MLTNGYELALQLPEALKTYMEDLDLVPEKDTSHKVKDNAAYYHGYQEGLKRTKKAQKELATLESSVQKQEVDLTHTYLYE
ncbi:hypothetical protein AAK913_14445 [Enterococcus faecium]|uniref:hypothetical protein n=1 Tax=Enterococcus TaxID=1350 RepID=UPI000B6BFE24|nr:MULTISPECIES: hypothetical protein [Enterococcus]EHK9937676.1 hypothetical protein [Enterococcus faecium]EME3582123.1 hypothetical protein [Enterococcus faecium]EME8127725.1 hypothetical protein [Enterococcus faecium]MDQ8386126.1 hypothetical protein [Enterococcus faecium]OTO50582.1 hypothetical protein A5814_002750 [Enterococcus faecium]